MRQAITENVWEQPGCELGRLLCPLNPSQPRSVQGLAPQHHEGGSYLRQVLGLSGSDCGAGLAGPKLLPGCAMMCIQAWRLHGCRAQREIIELMDICKIAGETSSGGSLMPDSSPGGCSTCDLPL